MFLGQRGTRVNTSAIRAARPAAETKPRPHGVGWSFATIGHLLAMLDVTIILSTSWLASLLFHQLTETLPPNNNSLDGLAMVTACIFVFRMRDQGHYDVRRVQRSRLEISNIAKAWLFCAMILVSLIFLLKVGSSVSRGAALSFFGLGFVSLSVERSIVKAIIRYGVRSGAIGKRNLIVIGSEAEINGLRESDTLASLGVADARYFVLADAPSKDGALSSVDDAVVTTAVECARAHDLQQILIAIEWVDTGRLAAVQARLRFTPCEIKLLPDRHVREVTQFPRTTLDPSLVVEVQRAPLDHVDRVLKRAVDLLLSVLGLFALTPLLAACAVLVRLTSPGPVLFVQDRNGFNGRVFRVYKFRTMTVMENAGMVIQATRGDPRVTPLGRFLRASSIDELPQLWNVLRGEMSIVGPRPHAVSHNDAFQKLLAEYAYRHHVKPGLTGWAQVNGSRGPTPSIDHVSRRVQLDLWYISNWTLWLDFAIMFRTISSLARHRDAF
ncbi:UDP-glucose:undecaprenyl-phosphate glucose-1-phosphate transferase [subsurface metagenome]